MPSLTISHVTTYSYARPVSFGPHRIMMRPRESFDQRLIEISLTITPQPADVRWLQDVFGNAVAVARFDRQDETLVFDSQVRMEHRPVVGETFWVEDYAKDYPFAYSAEDIGDLSRSIERQHLDSKRQVDGWARRFVRPGGTTPTLGLLADMTAAIKAEFTYVPRREKGTQTPIETLEKAQGTCRDFAVLMMEAARALGFAARFVSGYVYNPTRQGERLGGGNTHAWVRVFLPGSGWAEFDPTNGIVGNTGLVRVAVARHPLHAIPLSGSWKGAAGSYLGMKVDIEVRKDGEAEA